MRSIPIPQIKKAILKVRECPGDNSAPFGVGVTPALMLDWVCSRGGTETEWACQGVGATWTQLVPACLTTT